jgi:hypothetical protein
MLLSLNNTARTFSAPTGVTGWTQLDTVVAKTIHGLDTRGHGHRPRGGCGPDLQPAGRLCGAGAHRDVRTYHRQHRRTVRHGHHVVNCFDPGSLSCTPESRIQNPAHCRFCPVCWVMGPLTEKM